MPATLEPASAMAIMEKMVGAARIELATPTMSTELLEKILLSVNALEDGDSLEIRERDGNIEVFHRKCIARVRK